ncbi:MAG: hypothetical protein JSU07_11795 [Bacteroidetes bacterium]|nr:hypothetical protein [Bacteroidota bacterium]
MKKTIIFLFTAMTVSLTGFSQTTAEEYNYLTKGYKVQIESGLDMKKGYELDDVDAVSAGPRTATLKKLVKTTSGQKKIAAYLIIYQKEGNPKEYICVPNPNSDKEVSDAYWNMLFNGTNDSSAKLQLISYLLSRRLNW